MQIRGFWYKIGSHRYADKAGQNRKEVVYLKIERLNDSQIKCTLTSFDLSMRNLNLGELAYGSEKAKRLFQEMLQKAQAEFGFEVEGMPIMIEAMPLSDESVTLVITKVEDPEELDTRFARFAPMGDAFNIFNMDMEAAAAALLEGAEDPRQDGPRDQIRVFRFDSLDAITEGAQKMAGSFYGKSSVYKSRDGEKSYYLYLDGTDCDRTLFASTCNILSEYGKAVRHNYSSQAYYDEHYEVIIREDALDILAQI